jgi:hypothetical protein
MWQRLPHDCGRLATARARIYIAPRRCKIALIRLSVAPRLDRWITALPRMCSADCSTECTLRQDTEKNGQRALDVLSFPRFDVRTLVSSLHV